MSDIIDNREVALALQRYERRACQRNYGMPRNIVPFPERRKVVCTGFEVTNDKIKIWRASGAGLVMVSGTDNKRHYISYDYYPFADIITFCSSMTIDMKKYPPVMMVKESASVQKIELKTSRCDDDTEWECEPSKIVGMYINFGAVMKNGEGDGALDLIAEQNENANYIWRGIEFTITGDADYAPYHLIARDGQQYEYDVVRVCGHCAIGIVAKERLYDWSHTVWWHIGAKRYCIGEIVRQRPITDMEMFTWRLFIIKPQMEICYIG